MSNLTKRILSAAFLVPLILLLIFYASKLIFILVVSGIAGLSAYEFGTIALASRHRAFSWLLAVHAAILSLAVSLFFAVPPVILAALPFTILSLFCFCMFSDHPIDKSLFSFVFCLSGTFYCGLLVGFIGLTFQTQSTNGPYWILLLLLGTFMGDTGAYTFGRLFGKRKLAPSLSPGKTWAGAFGGLLTTSVSLTVLRFFAFPDMSLPFVLLLSFSLSAACQLGDLAESFIKRGIGVKDSGHLIPGHGGILDRIDALMFGAPIVFLFSMLH